MTAAVRTLMQTKGTGCSKANPVQDTAKTNSSPTSGLSHRNAGREALIFRDARLMLDLEDLLWHLPSGQVGQGPDAE